jgi:hypothetical protein
MLRDRARLVQARNLDLGAMAAHGGGDILQSTNGDDVPLLRCNHDPRWSDINLRTHGHDNMAGASFLLLRVLTKGTSSADKHQPFCELVDRRRYNAHATAIAMTAAPMKMGSNLGSRPTIFSIAAPKQ